MSHASPSINIWARPIEVQVPFVTPLILVISDVLIETSFFKSFSFITDMSAPVSTKNRPSSFSKNLLTARTIGGRRHVSRKRMDASRSGSNSCWVGCCSTCRSTRGSVERPWSLNAPESYCQ